MGEELAGLHFQPALMQIEQALDGVCPGQTAVARVPHALAPRPGDEVRIRLEPAFCTVFPG